MAPDILLLGANGQVGWELRRSLAPVGRLTALGRAELDVSVLDDVVRTIRAAKPSIIVNAAAYTAVDQAEEEQQKAFRVNAALPEVLAGEAKCSGALLVDYSTDYVFDGTLDRPYTETDPTNPLSTYGRSKLAGLRAIEASGCRYLVFRVSWVYGTRGPNFVRTILRLARQRTELRVVADQVGSLTPADLIADVTAQVIMAQTRGQGADGTYHLAPRGQTSWYGVAHAIVAEARRLGEPLKLSEEGIQPVTSDEYSASARRPANSVLDTGKLRAAYRVHLPAWEEALPRLISEMMDR